MQQAPKQTTLEKELNYLQCLRFDQPQICNQCTMDQVKYCIQRTKEENP